MSEELPIRMLKNDHEKVEEWFAEIRQTNSNNKEKIFDLLVEVTRNIKIHMEVEEELVYGKIADISDEGREMIEKSIQEHEMVRDIIAKMGNLKRPEDYTSDQIQELQTTVMEHIKREEDRVFVFAQEHIGDELGMGLSAKMFALKERLRLKL